MTHATEALAPTLPVPGNQSLDRAATNFCLWGLYAYLATLVLEGVIRHVTALAGVPSAIYARDGILLVTIGVALVQGLALRRNVFSRASVGMFLLIAHCCLSILVGVPLGAVLFAAKMMLVIVFGMACADAVSQRWSQFRYYLRALYVTAATGVLVNYFGGKMPWEGQLYDTMFGSMAASVEWWAGGERRIAGFSRASFDAAMILGVCGTEMLVSSKSRWLRSFIAALTLWLIYLTTSKGILASFLLMALWQIVGPSPARSFRSGAVMVWILVILGIAAPPIVVAMDIPYVTMRQVPTSLVSLWDRFTFMWPGAFDTLRSGWHWVLGAGLGSLGTARRMTDAALGNSADNLFLYAYVSIGFAGLIYLALMIKRGLHISQSCQQIMITAMLITMIGYGITTNMVEQSFFAVIFGVITMLDPRVLPRLAEQKK